MKNKKAITAEVFVVILLIVALVAVSFVWIIWYGRGRNILEMISNLFLL